MKLAELVFVEQPLEIDTLVLATHPFENIIFTRQVTTLLLMMTLSIADIIQAASLTSAAAL